jgi:hypothetical protein
MYVHAYVCMHMHTQTYLSLTACKTAQTIKALVWCVLGSHPFQLIIPNWLNYTGWNTKKKNFFWPEIVSVYHI